MTHAEITDPELEELTARAAPLDALLVDAALGQTRRLAPNSSTVRFAARLARHPVATRRRLGSLAAELARAVDALPKTATGKIRKLEIVPPAGPREGHDNDYHTTTG